MDIKAKKYLLTMSYLGILALVLKYSDNIGSFLGELLNVTKPLIFGFTIAFLLNGILKVYEKKLHLKRNKRLICVILTYLTALVFIITCISLIIPQLILSIEILVDNAPMHYETFKNFTTNAIKDVRLGSEIWMTLWQSVEEVISGMIKDLGKVASSVIPSVVSTTKSITYMITSIFFGIIISVYMLFNKEKLILQAKQVMSLFVPMKIRNKIFNVAGLLNETMSKFINGQIIEAFILGTLCFIAMTILKLPYSLLISFIIGISNIIPVFGPIVGTIPTSFIILMENPTNPMQVVIFLIMIVIVQRIDNDIIYPKVVGNSIGLSGLWVISAILVGGGLFGLPGMLLGVPIMAVIYRFLREAVAKKEVSENIKATRMKEDLLKENIEDEEAANDECVEEECVFCKSNIRLDEKFNPFIILYNEKTSTSYKQEINCCPVCEKKLKS